MNLNRAVGHALHSRIGTRKRWVQAEEADEHLINADEFCSKTFTYWVNHI